MKKLKILFILIWVSFDVHAKNVNVVYNKLKMQVVFLQSKCPQCINLNDVSCVKNKIHCCFKIDQYVRNNSKTCILDHKISELIKQVDVSNTDSLKTILQVHGWPIISKFGKKTDHEAWVLAQHADHDPEFQASIAFILEQLAVIGETDMKNFAYIYDRVASSFNRIGIKQKYGTQAIIENETIKIAPFQGSIQELNDRRHIVGLPPMKEYLKQLSEFYKLKLE